MYSNSSFVQGSSQNYEIPHCNIYCPPHQSMYNTSCDLNIQEHYVYPPDMPYANKNMSLINTERRRSDNEIIENFLRESEQSDNIGSLGMPCRKSNIAMTKITLTSAYKLNEKLEAICAELKSNEYLTEDEWQKKIDTCNAARCEILKLLGPIKDPRFLAQLKRELERRKRKRLREKVKREKWKSEKLLKAERSGRLHAKIDAWIRKEQAVIEKEKQEENLRKDADLILADVRGKRSDVRKYLGLLQELQNLHNVKTNIARGRGEHLSLAADAAFSNIIAKLTEQWATLDREYSIEEQGLKLMLKTDNEERLEKQKRSLFDEWENVLFGKRILMSDQVHTDLASFLTVRTAWDKYISPTSDASAIPIGWIVPGIPSSAAWQKYLKKEVL